MIFQLPAGGRVEWVHDPVIPPGGETTEKLMTFRAVRPDGNLLAQWIGSTRLLDISSPLAYDMIHVQGDYEYQQDVDGEWITLSRWYVPQSSPNV